MSVESIFEGAVGSLAAAGIIGIGTFFTRSIKKKIKERREFIEETESFADSISEEKKQEKRFDRKLALMLTVDLARHDFYLCVLILALQIYVASLVIKPGQGVFEFFGWLIFYGFLIGISAINMTISFLNSIDISRMVMEKLSVGFASPSRKKRK